MSWEAGIRRYSGLAAIAAVGLALALRKDAPRPGTALPTPDAGAARVRRGDLRHLGGAGGKVPACTDLSVDPAKLARAINTEPPGAETRELGDQLIYALAAFGRYREAANFAAAGREPMRAEWLAAAFTSWAKHAPEAAARAALECQPADVRDEAVNAALCGWGQVDPKGLAEFAARALPAGQARAQALAQALVLWSAADPLGAASWLGRSAPSADLDPGWAAVATHHEVMAQPAIASEWARNITDPSLRSRILAAIAETADRPQRSE